MTAPDSRDSVERARQHIELVEMMRGPDRTGWGIAERLLDELLSTRLQALARGPQQAGGEDAVQAAARIASEAACLHIDNERLQAEVARLTGANDALADALREANKGYVHELNRAETAEAALREAGRPVGYVYSEIVDVEGTEPVRIKRAALQGEYAQSLPNGTALYAALNGGQDDA